MALSFHYKGSLKEASLLSDLIFEIEDICDCLLYTSDAADERSSVDLGGRRIIKKKKKYKTKNYTEAKQNKSLNTSETRSIQPGITTHTTTTDNNKSGAKQRTI